MLFRSIKRCIRTWKIGCKATQTFGQITSKAHPLLRVTKARYHRRPADWRLHTAHRGLSSPSGRVCTESRNDAAVRAIRRTVDPTAAYRRYGGHWKPAERKRHLPRRPDDPDNRRTDRAGASATAKRNPAGDHRRNKRGVTKRVVAASSRSLV